jgi:predicted O-methyltransferase YrrM
MLPKVIQAYAEQGYRIDLGDPSYLCSRLRSAGNAACETGGGMSLTDALLFTALARVMNPAAIFIIGNAFGLSTFVIADLFPQATIDVIDAEVGAPTTSAGHN